MSQQPPGGWDRPPYPAPRDPLPQPAPDSPGRARAKARPEMTWSAQTETFLQAVERTREAPVLIRLEEGWRGHVEQLSLSSGDVMALEGCTVIRGSRVVMAHYMESLEDEEGRPVVDGGQRALLTIPLSSLPDLNVAVMVDPEGEMYHNFVDGHFGECSWGRQKEELIEDLENEDDHDYINEITVIDLKALARKDIKKPDTEVTVLRQAKGKPPTPPPKPHRQDGRPEGNIPRKSTGKPLLLPPKPHSREGSPARSPPPPRPPRRSIDAAQVPMATGSGNLSLPKPLSSRPPPTPHTPPTASCSPPPQSLYNIYALDENDRLSKELQQHHLDITFAGLDLHQSDITNVKTKPSKDKSKSAAKGHSKGKNVSAYVKMKKLLVKKPKKPTTLADVPIPEKPTAAAPTFMIEDDGENDDDDYVEIDDNYITVDDSCYACVNENGLVGVNTAVENGDDAAGKKWKKQDQSNKGRQRSPERKPVLIVSPLGSDARPPVPEVLKATPPKTSTSSGMEEPPITTVTSPLKALSCTELCDRLKTCGLPGVASTCKDNVIDGAFFLAMDDSAFRKPPFGCQDFELLKVHMIKSGWVPNVR